MASRSCRLCSCRPCPRRRSSRTPQARRALSHERLNGRPEGGHSFPDHTLLTTSVNAAFTGRTSKLPLARACANGPEGRVWGNGLYASAAEISGRHHRYRPDRSWVLIVEEARPFRRHRKSLLFETRPLARGRWTLSDRRPVRGCGRLVQAKGTAEL